jgi:hypothetical protein
MTLSTERAQLDRYLSNDVRDAALQHGFNLEDTLSFDSLVLHEGGFQILTKLIVGTQGALIFDGTSLIAVSRAQSGADAPADWTQMEPVRFGRPPAEVHGEAVRLFGDGPTLGTLEDYVRLSVEDSNLAYRIDVGHLSNLLDIAIDRLHRAETD